MRKIFFGSVLIICSLNSWASKPDTTFFDKDWNVCVRANAAFFRPQPKPEAGKFKVIDYYISGVIQMSGYFDSTDKLTTTGDIPDEYENGHFIFNYPNGKLSSEGDYKKGKLDGLWIFTADSTGRIQSEIMFRAGKWHGSRKQYHSNGKLYRHEVYIDGEFQTGKCFDEGGKEVAFFPSEQMPEPTIDLSVYFSKNIKYPKTARKKGIEGVVKVKFSIGTDGKIYDTEITQSLGSGCDEEAIRIIESMPAWKPGKQDGVPVKVYYEMPVRFKLVD